MRKLVVPAAALAGLVMTLSPGVALGADPAGTVSLTSSECREVNLTAKLAGGVYGPGTRFEVAVFVGPNGGGAPSEQKGLVEITFDKPGTTSFVLDRDSFGGEAFVKAVQVAGPDANVFAEKVITVDTSCARDEEPAPTTTPAPTEDPDPTETPDPTEDPEPTETTTPAPTTEAPPFNDLDCRDFPLADGRTAQDILNQTPTDDPNGLDADEDRIACEPGQDTAADGGDIADNDEPVGDVVTPSGGVATGGGPAWAFE